MPRVTTKGRKSLFLQAIANGDRVIDAAKYAKVDRTLPYIWAKKDKEFLKRWDDIRETLLPQLKDSAFELAREGNVQLLKFLIARYEQASTPAEEQQPIGEIRIIMPTADSQPQEDFLTIEEL